MSSIDPIAGWQDVLNIFQRMDVESARRMQSSTQLMSGNADQQFGP